MKNVNSYTKFIVMISVLAALILTPTSVAMAGSNGQQIRIFACNANRVVIQGHNQNRNGPVVTKTLNNPGCGAVYIKGFWWTGSVNVTAYYYVSKEAQSYNGQSMSVLVPTSQTNNDWYFVNFPTPTERQWILWRAQTWVNDKVPYIYGGGGRDGYNQDCSGYVSFAWQTPGFGTSEWKRYANQTSFDALQPGDALVTDAEGGHIILFAGWVNQSSGIFNAYEENIYSPDGKPGTASFHQITLLGGYLVAKGGYSYPGRYTAIRKNGL